MNRPALFFPLYKYHFKSIMGFSYGMNENQNHLVAEGRTTSRVLSVPGGKSSVHLGWDSPKNSSESSPNFPQVKVFVNVFNVSFVYVLIIEAPTTAVVSQKEKENLMKVIGSTAPTVKQEDKEQKQQASRTGNSGISSNAYAQGSRQNVGNVITDRPTSRVTQPPGGRSSISFY